MYSVIYETDENNNFMPNTKNSFMEEVYNTKSKIKNDKEIENASIETVIINHEMEKNEKKIRSRTVSLKYNNRNLLSWFHFNLKIDAYKCEECSFSTSSKHGLKQHITKQHTKLENVLNLKESSQNESLNEAKTEESKKIPIQKILSKSFLNLKQLVAD